MERPFGRETTPLKEDLLTPWSLTTYESWDDPPSRFAGGLPANLPEDLLTIVEEEQKSREDEEEEEVG